MADSWLYGERGQTQPNGPVTKAVLGQLFARGEITRQSIVWNDQMTDWLPIENVPELRDILFAAPPPPKPSYAPPPPSGSGSGYMSGIVSTPFSGAARKKVELRNVSKVYKGGGYRAAANVSFDIADKEVVVLLGASGSGKSTILRMMAGIENITEGEIYMEGRLLNNVPRLDRNIAMVGQNYGSLDGPRSVLDVGYTKSRMEQGELSTQLTIYENLAYDLKAKKVPKDEIDRRIKDVAKLMEIDRYLDRKPKNLSLGQMLHVALARTIILNPLLFIIDNPLVNLDRKMQDYFSREELPALFRRLNATVIYACSYEPEALAIGANRIIVLKDGMIQ